MTVSPAPKYPHRIHTHVSASKAHSTDILTPIQYPRYISPPPWGGGDLQTIRNFLRKPTVALDPHPAERLEFPMGDGSDDVLIAALNRPPAPKGPRPLAVLSH